MSIHKSLYKASEYDEAKMGRKWPLTTRHDSKTGRSNPHTFRIYCLNIRKTDTCDYKNTNFHQQRVYVEKLRNGFCNNAARPLTEQLATLQRMARCWEFLRH